MTSGGSISSTEVSKFQSGTDSLFALENPLSAAPVFLQFPVARSYRELFVWKKARTLAVHVYQSTEQFPRTEVYGLTSQIRRAVVSVVSNIAEGQGRLTTGEFLHFLGQARGSLLELDAQLIIASDLSYLDAERYTKLSQEIYEVLGLLNRLIESLPRKHAPSVSTLKL
jgi:four helix bundle protein